MKKKWRTLIFPYFIWVSLYMMVYFIGQQIPISKPYFANPGRIVSQFRLVDYIGAYCGYVGNGLFVNALWFVRDLIIFNIFSIFIKKTIDRFPFFIFILNLVYWMTNIKILFNNESICFFILGYYVVRYRKHMFEIDTLPLWQICTSYIILVALQYYFHVFDSHNESVLESLSVPVGMILLVRTSKYLVNSTSKAYSFFKFIASYSFFIYASHDLIQIIYKKLFVRILCQTPLNQLIEYIGIPILTIITSILIGTMIKKVTNKGFALLSGGR